MASIKSSIHASLSPGPNLNKKMKSEQSVMGTNNSSITSKRSVERLYYPEPHFFRYFVQKPQRRAPLINRGYWLRMHAIDAVVRQFLDEGSSPSKKRKLILNLGCGYDPLAFQWLSKIQESSLSQQDATFIDVDFPELISKKSEMISATPQICEVLGNIKKVEDSEGIFLQSDAYYALGCDLADTNKLEKLLGKLVDISECQILCIAEVSTTYMNVDAADALFAWVARLSHARICLLEQYLPDGADHPFAQKMLKHFNNLQTPLKNVGTYPRLCDQVQRFHRAGFRHVQARSLWDIFCDPCIVSHEERTMVDAVEPFDEWEELILFASHYFLLIAEQQGENSMHQQPAQIEDGHAPTSVASTNSERLERTSASSSPCPAKRFGAIVRKKIHDNHIYHIGGLGPQTRTMTTNTYRVEDQPTNDTSEKDEPIEGLNKQPISLPRNCEARMCFTCTNFDSPESSWLLVGGRKSPHEPLQDCWLLKSQQWQRVDNLPIPLYRYCSTNVIVGEKPDTVTPGVLIYGGKTLNNTVSNKWYLWRELAGWETVTANIPFVPRFGAVMISCGKSRGIILGGMSQDGIICKGVWIWDLFRSLDHGWSLTLTDCVICGSGSDPGALEYLYRFGATIERVSQGLLLIGGVADKIITSRYEVLKISTEGRDFSTDGPLQLCLQPLTVKLPSPRSLLVGHSSLICSDQAVVVVGGGAVCFSFGTHCNTAPVVFGSHESSSGPNRTLLVRPCEPKANGAAKLPPPDGQRCEYREHTIIEEPALLSARTFEQISNLGQPVVSRKLGLGPCVTEWQSLDTVKDRVGVDQDVIVHVSGNRHMDFQQKNFDYVEKPFGLFIDDFKGGHKQYLRSLASHDPVGKPADFQADFPRLAQDFTLFDQMSFLTDKIHSSVLRISGFVDMWLHYDVMANILCQIRGTKHLVLFPPSDVSFLSFPAGSSTSSVDAFHADFSQNPALAQTHPHHIILHPNDVLYIPPLWLHAASPIDHPGSDGVSISINVFFRSLQSGYAPGRDVYGNRDVQAYEKGRRDLEKMTRLFDGLPADMRQFYLDRLADELKEHARISPSG